MSTDVPARGTFRRAGIDVQVVVGRFDTVPVQVRDRP
jgi:hypothetical protein